MYYIINIGAILFQHQNRKVEDLEFLQFA